MAVQGWGQNAPGNSPALMGAPTFNSGFATMTVWGRGWSSENDQSVFVDAGGSLTLTDGAGNQIPFFRVSGSTSFPVYASRINYYSTMTALAAANGSPTLVGQRGPDGTSLLFSVAESTNLLRLSQLTDRNGNNVNFTRNGQGRLTRVIDVHGRFFALTYNPAGLVASLTDSGGRTSNYTYDSQKRRTSESGPLGTTSYIYDSQNRMTRITYPNGGVKNYAYDSENRVRTEDEGNGNNLLTYVYGESSTTITDALGRVTVNQFISVQGIKKLSSVTDPAVGVTSFTYDANLNLASQTDPLGRVTNFTYDSQGNVTATQDPLGGTTRASYEPVFNQVAALTDPLNHTTNMSYNGKGDLTLITDPLSGVTQKSYDVQGHVTQNQDPLTFTTAFTYDQLGALASVKDPVNRTTAMLNDALSRVVRNTDPAGKVTQYAYDAAGDLTQVTDALNNVTNYAYDPGRSSKLLRTVTDALGHATSFGYDDLGRLTSVTNALGQTKTSAYDAKGNLTQTKNARNQTITYAYDSLDRLITKTTPEGAFHYTYDAAGNLTNVTHPNGSSIANTYDSLNRVTQVIQNLTNGYAATIGYGYDANGNRTSMTTPWGSFSYAYDANNRLTSITNPQNKTFGFDYDANGRRTSLTYPNGIVTTYAYDHAGQLLSILHTRTADGVVIASAAYTYDVSGNRTSMTDVEGVHTYAYDSSNRLTSASHPEGTILPIQNETFSMDAVGNRLADAALTNYAYDAANRLRSNSGFTYAYDADGSQASRTETATSSQTAFSYDSENRLAGAILPDATAWSDKYDAAGRRIEKSSGTAASQVMRFIYDTNLNLLAMLDGANSPISIFTGGLMIDEPLEMRKADGSEFFYHADALRSVIGLTDASALLTERTAYEAYGKAVFIDLRGPPSTASRSFTGSPFAYTAQILDEETGLINFKNRQGYDPATGRFGQNDPIGIKGGINSDVYVDSVGKGSNNAYQYASNNPERFTDPLGLYVMDYSYSWGLGAGAVVGAQWDSTTGNWYGYAGGGIVTSGGWSVTARFGDTPVTEENSWSIYASGAQQGVPATYYAASGDPAAMWHGTPPQVGVGTRGFAAMYTGTMQLNRNWRQVFQDLWRYYRNPSCR